MDRAAAMWAAHDPAWFVNFRHLHPKVRTVRGLHAKWKEAQKPQPEAPKVGNRGGGLPLPGASQVAAHDLRRCGST